MTEVTPFSLGGRSPWRTKGRGRGASWPGTSGSCRRAEVRELPPGVENQAMAARDIDEQPS
jgi:hypothetical protein